MQKLVHKQPASRKLCSRIATMAIAFVLATAGYTENSDKWLQSQLGSRNQLGEEVIGLSREDNITIIDVRLPQRSHRYYEEVIVIGKRPDPKSQEPIISLVKAPQWLHNDDNEPYGLRFYIKGIDGFEFRIQLGAQTSR